VYLSGRTLADVASSILVLIVKQTHL